MEKIFQSPGIDDLPKEFYELFWDFLGDSFAKMANFSFKEGKLSATQRTGVIFLICKNKKLHLLSFWRPISLLCVDYKVISTCITDGVEEVMGFSVYIDKAAAVVGRSIHDNIHQKGLK